MGNLGTWNTLDTPCLEGQGAGVPPSEEQRKLITNAKCFLTDCFSEIGGRVRIYMNPHDFGDYPSFEIDTPDWYEMTSLNQDFEDDDMDLEGDRQRLDDWNEKANEIEERYCKMFEKYL